MAIHNLRKYKESLALIPDVEAILKVLTLTEGALIHYTHYIPAFKVLVSIKQQKQLLRAYHKELLTIKNSKGKRTF